MNKKRLSWLLILSVSGWLFSSYLLFNYMHQQRHELQEMATENAFNIVSQALQDVKYQQGIVATMELWFDNHWTAQTGSVTTLCELGRPKLRRILTEDGVSTICRMRI